MLQQWGRFFGLLRQTYTSVLYTLPTDTLPTGNEEGKKKRTI